MELADEVRRLTSEFHRDEYELRSQMRRASISIPSNIAEGSRRSTKKDYAQFLRIACGSAVELETQLLLAKRWYPKLQEKTATELVIEIEKILSTIIRKLGI